MSPEPKTLRLIVANLLAWFSANARDLPWRRTHDPYAIHVSEIMLQQTQVKTVIPYWERWLLALPTIADAAKADSAKLHKLWEGLGYYTRVRNLQKAAQMIVAQHGGKFPEVYADVLELPGIGRYTAGAICSIAFNQPTPILDGNVIRVLTRVFGIAENPKEKPTNERLWRLAEALVVEAAGLPGAPANAGARPGRKRAPRHCSELNQSLMELGALVCTPRQPQCLLCPLHTRCTACREGRVDQLPNLGQRQAATARHFAAFVMERDGHLLVRQRPAGAVNAHLWEFPNVELTARNAERARASKPNRGPSAEVVAAAQTLFGDGKVECSPLVTIKHSITRYRITLDAFRLQTESKVIPADLGGWKTPAQLRRLAFTSAHRRVLRVVLPPEAVGE